jgi:histidinol-phosphatase
MKPTDLSKYLEFAVETAYLAGRLTLGYYQVGLEASYKGDNSPVTIADQKAEELIRGRINKAYPSHSIVGEEFGSEATGSVFRWLIDPIDGTKSFLHGVPLYGVLVGLEIEDQVQVGAAYFPALDEMLAGATGLGCWWNGRRARVSIVSQMDRAVFSTTSVKLFDKHGCRDVFEKLNKACYYQVGWGDAYGYLLVATGRAEIMVDGGMNEWDCAPFPPILEEAGGYFGDWEGNPGIHTSKTLATSRLLLPEVLEIIRSSEPPAAA